MLEMLISTQSFLLSHIAISGLPLLLFIALTITVGVFSILGGLLVGLLGALLFIVVAVGFALIILLPTLFFTTLVATFLWLWGMGTYQILKYFNKKDIPGIHTDLKSGLLGGDSENDKLDALNGRPNGARPAPKLEKRDGPGEEKKANGGAKASKASGTDLGQNLGELQKRADLGNVTNGIGDTKEKLDGVTKNLPVDGVTKNVPVDGVTKNLPIGL